jgi:predicted DNA repair protein MutK
VKLDDAGLWLSRRPNAAAQALGRAVLVAAPWLMKALSVAGTAAMFLVGGGILVHGVPLLHHGIANAVAGLSGWAALLTSTLAEAGVGMIAGVLVLAGVMAFQRLRARSAAA